MPATLTITMDDHGNAGVNGPLENRVLCYGLLEIAKETIHQKGEQDQKLVKVASAIQLVAGH